MIRAPSCRNGCSSPTTTVTSRSASRGASGGASMRSSRDAESRDRSMIRRRRVAAWACLGLALVALAMPAGAAAGGSADPDHDGLPSSYERQRTQTDPALPDTDGDGTPDGREDADGD